MKTLTIHHRINFGIALELSSSTWKRGAGKGGGRGGGFGKTTMAQNVN